MRHPGEPAFDSFVSVFIFPLNPFGRLLAKGRSGVSGAGEANAWKHSAFCFLTASGDKAEIRALALASNLKQILLVVGAVVKGGIQGVKKVKKRGKGGEEVARKGNIVNPLSVWRCLFLSLAPPPPPPPVI